MTGYPITYGDILEEGNGLTTETLFTKISEYASNEKTRENLYKGSKFGLLFFGVGSLLISSVSAFADNNNGLDNMSKNLNVDSCSAGGSGSSSGAPAPNPTLDAGKSEGLANVLTSDRSVFTAIAMKTGTFYIDFVCAAVVLVGVRMANIPADRAM